MSSAAKLRRGKFIVFEGLDKAGKSTQCARLIANLQAQGHQVQGLRFPDRTTPIGRLIDEYLRSGSHGGGSSSSSSTGVDTTPSDQAIHLLFSANRWEHAMAIKNTLASGTSIVCDRYYYSGCVYSAAKGVPGLDLAWARAPDVGLPRPDLCLLLDVSTDVAMRRAGGEVTGEDLAAASAVTSTGSSNTPIVSSDDPAQTNAGEGSKPVQERYETPAMQARVRQLFDELRSGTAAERHVDEADDIVVVDASTSLDEVGKDILEKVLRVFEEVDASGDTSGAPLRRVRAW